jgi:hypothetical protein
MQGLSPGVNSNIGKYTEFYLRAGFMSVGTYQTVNIRKHPPVTWQGGMYADNDTVQVMLNHFPYRQGDPPTDYVDKYWDKRPVYNPDVFLIHGHQHNKTPFQHGNQFNVSVEVTNYQPVSEYDISKAIELYGIQDVNINNLYGIRDVKSPGSL